MKILKNIEISIVITFLLLSCSNEQRSLKIVDTILSDTSSYFYTDLNPYKIKNTKLLSGSVFASNDFP